MSSKLEKAALYGVNLIVHPTNIRVKDDLEVCIKHKVPLIITSLGAVSEIVESVHSYGGIVYHDIIKRHAEKATEVGVDGLVLVRWCWWTCWIYKSNFFDFRSKKIFKKTILLSGCISTEMILPPLRKWEQI